MLETSRKLLIVGAFFMPMLAFRIAGQQTATTNTGLTVSDAFFFLSAGFLALSIRRRKIPPTPLWNIGAVLVVLGGLGSCYFADIFLASLFVVARMIFVLVVWQISMRYLVDNERWMTLVITAYVAGCAVSGFVAILQLEFHLFLAEGGLVNGRAFGLAHHPDDTGSFLALGLTFATALALHPRVKRQWYHIGFIALIAIGLIVSGSVSGMICALGGSMFVLLRRGIKVSRLIGVTVVLVGVYAGGIAIQGGNGKSSLNPIARFKKATGAENGGGNSVTPRIGTIKGAWDGIVDDPVFGHGLDVISSLTYLDRNVNVEYPTHNFILMAWFQGGIFFLIGDLICIGEALRRMIKGKRDPTKDMLLAGALAVIVFALQAPMMFDRYFWFPFVLAMTLRGGPVHGVPGELPAEETADAAPPALA
jgi:O-antigen ligase